MWQLLPKARELSGLEKDDMMLGGIKGLDNEIAMLKTFEERSFGSDKYSFKKAVRQLKNIGPLHFMVLRLEETETFEERINLVRNIESMIRLPRPLIQLFLVRMDIHMLVSKILLGEAASHTDKTHMLKYLTEELEIACFDFLGELLKANLRVITLFESQMGPNNLRRLLEKGLTQPVNSNLFFRSLMISLLYLMEENPKIAEHSYLIKTTLESADSIFIGLLESVREKPMDSNNKSTVITCLMVVHTYKMMGMHDKVKALMQQLLDNDRLYADIFLNVLKTGMVYFA